LTEEGKREAIKKRYLELKYAGLPLPQELTEDLIVDILKDESMTIKKIHNALLYHVKKKIL